MRKSVIIILWPRISRGEALNPVQKSLRTGSTIGPQDDGQQSPTHNPPIRNTAGQAGRSGLLKILLGRDSRKLSKLKLDHLDEYGSLSFMRREALLKHIDHLIERGAGG